MPRPELEQAHEPDPPPSAGPRGAVRRPRRLAWLLGLTGLAAVLTWVGVDRWARGELMRVERELKRGEIGAARVRLDRLGMLRLGGLEAEYWRGACEEAEGDVDAALALWGRIPAGSSRFANATLRRARLAIDRGRLAVAEATLERTRGVFPPGSTAHDLHEIMLQQVYLFTSRDADLRRRKRAEAATTKDKADVLRKLWLIDETWAYPLAALRTRLDEAGRAAPEDDRVWLGKANFATRTARFAEADAWLKRCLERRPEDPAVWRSRLEWATASDRLDAALEASRHLPADGLEPDAMLSLRAWLAARLGDPHAEQAALDQWLAQAPGETRALARRIAMAAEAGRADEVAALRRRKAERDRASDAYRMALSDRVPSGRFDELGRLAESLGRRFEARGWWTLALQQTALAAQARAALARLDRDEQGRKSISAARATPSARTLADAMADLIRRDDRGRSAAQSSTEPAVPVFRDDAPAAGLRFTYENDPTPRCRLPETMGGGVGLLDYDGDGRLDVYAVQGGKLPDEPEPSPAPMGDRLFRNRGDGTFDDVTATAGLSAMRGGYGHGVAVGDIDNDGHPDLLVTRWRSYALYRNRGDGTFADVTEAWGLGGSRDWPTSSAFADLDGDGDLDLYVCHYADWDPRHSAPCPHPDDPRRFTYCGPRVFAAMPDHVFRNEGGRFVDVSDRAGIRGADRDGRGLGVVAAHLDDDDRIDLFVANDMSANFLFANRGGLRFEETGAESGVATNADGGYLAGMGVACGDLDGDGRPDLVVTNFYGESTTFYQNLGGGQFVDRTAAIGLGAASRYLLGFGVAFLDADNDGRLDLATANGHVNDLRPNVPFVMPASLMMGSPSGRLVDVSRRAGAAWEVPRLGRGLALGDLDNDGRLDLVIVAEGQPMAYFHNQGPAGHFVTFQLEGTAPGSNRDAVGARLSLTASGHRQVSQRVGGSSFLSANDGRLHFGLGTATRIETIEVRWPSGHVDRYDGLEADTGYYLREGQPQAAPLRGWQRTVSPP
ncbi:MAG: FG-GAP-like repeat-containing protein [Isosphaeraceae bacterium]